MSIKKDNFIDILTAHKPPEMLNFLARNGKKPKPISPIYFNLREREEINNGSKWYEWINDGN